jgi:hypothetical protein
MKGNSSKATLSRRAWIGGSSAGLAALLTAPRLLAQDPGVGAVLQLMSRLTGTKLEDRWVEPTATLVSVILEDSKSLRSLGLGEIEPATAFSVADPPQ